MQRTKLNYLIDVILFFSFIGVFVTGLLRLPLLGLQIIIENEMITKIHNLSGILMGVIVIIHLILHWNWIVSMTKSFFRKK
ncbi:MAG: DUF4405 domain-containing protein [Candidatus ainarchaeum sp.]|nr:DUF4405 domain-containing protein [Candidatus ainarchaeum sp.]